MHCLLLPNPDCLHIKSTVMAHFAPFLSNQYVYAPCLWSRPSTHKRVYVNCVTSGGWYDVRVSPMLIGQSLLKHVYGLRKLHKHAH